jgi:crotonobetainyl-CoA:carnitine CoA-transferase CaiB-like acyl-CoA transferase
MSANHPEDKFWSPFCEAIGRTDLIADPRFHTKEAREVNGAALMAEVDPVFLTKSRQEWLDVMREKGVLFAPVNSVKDVLSDPQALINGYIVDFDHPHLGTLRLPGYPVQFEKHSAGPRTAAPAIGQHTVEILHELGYEKAAIEELRVSGVIRFPGSLQEVPTAAE